MMRTAVLLDDRDKRVGKTAVPETVFVIKCGGALYVRTEKGVRLPGGGIGVFFIQTELYVRERLEPA